MQLANRGHLVLSYLGLVFVLMLRPFIPEIVMSTDLMSFEHPSVLQFRFNLVWVFKCRLKQWRMFFYETFYHNENSCHKGAMVMSYIIFFLDVGHSQIQWWTNLVTKGKLYRREHTLSLNESKLLTKQLSLISSSAECIWIRSFSKFGYYKIKLAIRLRCNSTWSWTEMVINVCYREKILYKFRFIQLQKM